MKLTLQQTAWAKQCQKKKQDAKWDIDHQLFELPKRDECKLLVKIVALKIKQHNS
jgi:hypothetical protein